MVIEDAGFEPPNKEDQRRYPHLGLRGSYVAEVSIRANARIASSEHLLLIVRAESADGVLEIGELTIRPGRTHTSCGLVTTDLRDIPLAEIGRQLLEHSRSETPFSDEEGSFLPPFRPPRGWATNLAKRSGRRGTPELDYAIVAAKYVALLSQAKPLIKLAKKLDLRPSQARSMLYEARRRGFLTAAPKGKPGGNLTPKALDVMRQHVEGTNDGT